MKSQKWKAIPMDMSSFTAEDLEAFGGIEELSDYEIIRSDGSSNKQKKRKKTKTNKEKNKKLKIESNDDTLVEEDDDCDDDELDMSAWGGCLHDSIIRALKELGFQKPTKIQELTIPSAIRGNQDILGAAETGSGKTLAFGIPIVNNIISIKESRRQKAEAENIEYTKPLYSIILTPTRELAIQIKKHLQAVCKYTDIKIGVLVGGLAPEKQKRILKKCPEIIVATPGRLWEMIEEGVSHVSQISNVRFLVIDETDRMVEKGHFAELTQILSLINGNESNKKRQTFVFSATLTLIHDVPNRIALKKRKKKTTQAKQKIESLVKLIGMKNPKVIDITKKTAVVETLTETQIMCSIEDKDSYLYYFILMHPGRTLVFCNSIDCVRRLRNVLELLECHPLPLHASMHQRQRLKNLETFEKSENGILLATDVAARGLDIRGIEHVIHFQVPRTTETYVHRSGRTARAEKEGLSLLLIEPQEGLLYKRICKTLSKEQAIPNFPVDHKILKLVKERVTLARQIDKLEHRMNRLNAQNRWFKNAANDMEIDVEEDLLNDIGDEREQAAKAKEVKALRKQLKAMLSKPIISKILTGCFPTKSGKLLSPSIYCPQKAVEAVKSKESCRKKNRKKKQI
ncbi:ATP-dependent RNA helicase DDX24-like [Argiope bruennichi]|uniref:ATP-dependent RNA helicase n=1 Tax=Argiope bruennichi TaxID=94029 RepID=A0A8T0FAL8_ARGBR|nr:ATP-dependent RNA helicase DDX24-like [Argiope bruennichi]KAF8787275.1 ATP-dependent RNA helicase DDX24 like protein [Argiope bruennichi]